MACGRAWQHTKYSYGVWKSFFHHSDNLKTSKSINVNTFFKSSDLDPNSRTNICLPARMPARSVAIVPSKKSIRIGGKKVP